MNRKLLLFFFALSVLCFSCSKEDDDEEPDQTTGGTGGTGGSGGTGGTGGTGGSTTPYPKGTFKIRIYRPGGNCASSATYNGGKAFRGEVIANSYDENRVHKNSQTMVSYQSNPSYSSTNTYWEYTSYNDRSKIFYTITPSKSSWPNECNRIGEESIDFEGQVKTIVLQW